MKLLKCTITILFFALLSAAAHAQPSLAKMKMQIDAEEKLQPLGRSMQLINSTQAGLLFKNNSLLRQADLVTWLTQKLQLRSSEDQLVDDNTDVSTNGNYLVKKLHQYYKGIKVEHGVVNSTSLAGNLAMMQLEYYSIPDQFNIRPSISGAMSQATA